MTKSGAVLGLVAGVLLGQAVEAAEITVLSAVAVEPGLRAAAAAFEKQTGHVVKISFVSGAVEIRTRVGGGEMWDVVIVPPAVLDEFAQTGKVEKERVTVGRVGMGVAVRSGAPAPDISNVEALKRSVVAAESLYSLAVPPVCISRASSRRWASTSRSRARSHAMPMAHQSSSTC